ncbi:MAG: pyridoxal-phosphate dependent enzyme, partial [Euryarchaeota archaeon]|nr:pyridoxal-phosphate dependent enzyme [Euryarchaeota archaeon]
MRCPRCNSALDAEYDYESIRRVILRDEFMREYPHHWKYRAFMPVSDLSRIVTMGEGGTPLIDMTGLVPQTKKFLVKYEAANPTGSFKDRGSSLEITKAVIGKKKRAVIASTGNMGSSIAAFAAFAKLKCKIIIPDFVSREKITQMKAYGAEVEMIEGDYSDAMKIAEDYVRSDHESFLAGDYPWRCEGTKTVGFE